MGSKFLINYLRQKWWYLPFLFATEAVYWVCRYMPLYPVHLWTNAVQKLTSSVRSNTLRTKHLDRQLVLGYRPLITPTPFPRELTWKYNCMLTYIPVSFLFSFKNFVPVGLKIR